MVLQINPVTGELDLTGGSGGGSGGSTIKEYWFPAENLQPLERHLLPSRNFQDLLLKRL